MGTNNAQAYYSLNGMPIDNIRDFSAVPNGGEGTARRVINRSKKSPGRRQGQNPDYTVTFQRDVVEGSQDIDWWGMLKAKTEFVMAEHLDAITHNYADMNVESIAPSVDENGNAMEDITCSALDMDTF